MFYTSFSDPVWTSPTSTICCVGNLNVKNRYRLVKTVSLEITAVNLNDLCLLFKVRATQEAKVIWLNSQLPLHSEFNLLSLRLRFCRPGGDTIRFMGCFITSVFDFLNMNQCPLYFFFFASCGGFRDKWQLKSGACVRIYVCLYYTDSILFIVVQRVVLNIHCCFQVNVIFTLSGDSVT